MLPPPVPAGGTIGVMAPAGPCPSEALDSGVAWLRGRGYKVVVAPNARSRTGYLAGSDAERLDGVTRLLDRGVHALIATRGGYGVMRLLPELPWDRLSAWGGWVVGFSDITALHAALAARGARATLHGPMVTSLARDPRGAESMVSWLSGRAGGEVFRFSQRHVLRAGSARGVSVGGTLSIMAALAGTPFEPPYDGCVLFLEDVGEPLYRLDRLLTQLRLSSRLGRARAVILGRLSRCGRGEAGWRERWRDLVLAAAPNAVVVEGLPFGHGGTNVAFPLGVELEIDTRRGVVSWGGG